MFEDQINVNLTIFRMKKPPPPPLIFSPVISKTVGVSPKNFVTFIFNRFFTFVSNFKVIPNARHKLLNLNQKYPSKKRLFRPILFNYNNFSHRNVKVTKLWSRGHILFESRDNF